MKAIFPYFLVCCIGMAFLVHSCKNTDPPNGNPLKSEPIPEGAVETKATFSVTYHVKPSIPIFRPHKTNLTIEWTIDEKLLTDNIQDFKITVMSLNKGRESFTEVCPDSNCRSHTTTTNVEYGDYVARIVARDQEQHELAHTAMSFGFEVKNADGYFDKILKTVSAISIFHTQDSIALEWTIPGLRDTEFKSWYSKYFYITIKRADGTGDEISGFCKGAHSCERPTLKASLPAGYHIVEVKSRDFKHQQLSAGFLVKKEETVMNGRSRK